MRDVLALILAAGRGVRMRSPRPKLLHPVAGLPVLSHVLARVRELGVRRTVVVAARSSAWVRAFGGAQVVRQHPPLGTAHAVMSARRILARWRGRVLILAGDMPLLARDTLRRLAAEQARAKASLAVLSGTVPDPCGWGRILRGARSRFEGICEELDLTGPQRAIREVNTGVYVAEARALLEGLASVRKNARKGEYYLTDVAAHLARAGRRVEAFRLASADELVGVNTQEDLAEANVKMTQRILRQHLDAGVTLLDPDKTVIEAGVKIGRGTVIYPFTYIERGVRIGAGCHIGPFAKLREGTRVEDGAVVGSFVEVVRSRIGRKSRVKHLAYLGDADIGQKVNVGAGTVTANFDGRAKHKTRVGDGALLGCNTVLVAPVRVGRRARTGAGAVVLAGQHVRGGQTVVGVPAQPRRRGRR